MAEDVVTISDMCAAFGVTARTLRFYEDKALLAPRRDGQRRLFTARDRARLKLILQGKRFGFSLEDIRALLDLYDPADGGRRQQRATLAVAETRLAAMRRQRDELDVAIADLDAQLAAVRALLAAPAAAE